MFKTNQFGRSMIEMIGVLGIISVLATGLITLVSKVFDKYKQSTITTQIRDLQKNIRMRYSPMVDYKKLVNPGSLAELIKERVIPTNMVIDGKVYHAYSGPVIFAATDYTYSITFNTLKKEGCIDLLNLSWTVNDTSDLVELVVNNKKFNWTGTSGHQKLPITGLEPYGICDEDRTKNKITWTFQ